MSADPPAEAKPPVGATPPTGVPAGEAVPPETLPSLEDDLERPGRRPGRGDRGPDFCLPGTGNRNYHLADFAGEPVVLVFYPADNSPICTQQLRSYSEDLSEFEGLGATVLCLSPQDVATHEEFARQQHLRLPLLADVDKEVGRAYNVLGPLGFYRRSIFVLDGSGVITYARRSLSSMTYVPADDILVALRSTTS